MQIFLSKRGNVVWEYIQLFWFSEAVIIYILFLDML